MFDTQAKTLLGTIKVETQVRGSHMSLLQGLIRHESSPETLHPLEDPHPLGVLSSSTSTTKSSGEPWQTTPTVGADTRKGLLFSRPPLPFPRPSVAHLSFSPSRKSFVLSMKETESGEVSVGVGPRVEAFLRTSVHWTPQTGQDVAVVVGGRDRVEDRRGR